MSELKPCPFCGGVSEVWGQGIDWVVKCVKCNAKSTWTYTEAEAIEAWNKRESDAENARLWEQHNLMTAQLTTRIHMLEQQLASNHPIELVPATGTGRFTNSNVTIKYDGKGRTNK